MVFSGARAEAPLCARLTGHSPRTVLSFPFRKIRATKQANPEREIRTRCLLLIRKT
jgi:hypothetical protein